MTAGQRHTENLDTWPLLQSNPTDKAEGHVQKRTSDVQTPACDETHRQWHNTTDGLTVGLTVGGRTDSETDGGTEGGHTSL